MIATFRNTTAVIYNNSGIKVAQFNNVSKMIQSGTTIWLLNGEDDCNRTMTRIEPKGNMLNVSMRRYS